MGLFSWITSAESADYDTYLASIAASREARLYQIDRNLVISKARIDRGINESNALSEEIQKLKEIINELTDGGYDDFEAWRGRSPRSALEIQAMKDKKMNSKDHES